MTRSGLPPDTSLVTVRGLVALVSARVPAQSEARWIVAQAAGLGPGELLASFDAPVSPQVVRRAGEMTDHRALGEPLQYVLGSWSFRQLEMRVDPRALIPRPETEQVVEVALEELRRLWRRPGRRPRDDVVAVDLGTGSGVIALSLALEGQVDVSAAGARLQVWATDASPAALALAGENLSSLEISHPAVGGRLRLAEGSWFEALPASMAGCIDLVVSNPPYVSEDEWSRLDPVVRDHEPHAALVPGPTGLEALLSLVDQARRWLIPGGALVLELAPHQAATVAGAAADAGYGDVRVRRDLGGRERALVASWPGA